MTLVAVGAAGAGVVLGAAGITKLVDPSPTARLFAALGLRGGRRAARAAGLVELGLALWLLATGARWAAGATALAYVVLLLSVLTLRRRSPSTPCGCFGQWSGPPSARHVIVNTLGAATCGLAAATATAVAPPRGTGSAGSLGWWVAVAAVAVVGVIALGGGRPEIGGTAAPTAEGAVAGDADRERRSGNREVRR